MKIDVAAHISNLLYEHNRVIVPNLGGFCSNYKHANTEKYGHISPPTKELYFDESLNFHDNVLIEDLVQSYDISYSEALTHVEKFVSNVKNNITSSAVNISNIGRLYLDARNDIILAPSSVNFLEDSFGLPKMEYYPLSRNAEKAAILPVQEVPERQKGSRFKETLLNIWNDQSARAVVIIVLLVIIVLPLLSQLSNKETERVNPTIIENETDLVNKNETFKPFEETVEEEVVERPKEVITRDEAAVVPTETPVKKPTPKVVPTTETPPKKEVEKPAPVPVKPPVAEKPKPVTETPKPTTKTSDKRKDYVIVIGNFSTEANANIATKEVKKAGYVAYTKKITATKYRVGISLNCKIAELDAKLLKVKTTFPEAWVMNR